MRPLPLKDHLLLIGVILWYCKLHVAFEIVEKVDIFRQIPCPAFLMFENAAYLADMSFELPCSCKPEEVGAVVWYYQKDIGSKETTVLTDYNGTTFVDSSDIRPRSKMMQRFSIRMFSLIVFRAQVEDTGHYICGSRRGSFFYGYDIDIQSSSDTIVLFGDYDQHPSKDEKDSRFTTFTTFWEWTKCDRCDVRGEQMRIGLCYIKSEYLFTRYRRTIPDVASCGSASVPKRFKRSMTKRKPEIYIRSCTSRCRGVQSQSIKGALTQKITEVIASLGSKLSIELVPIQFYNLQVGYGLILSCPDARPELAVAWDKGKERLYRKEYLIGVKERMRIYIDYGNQLHITYSTEEDAGFYRCWLEGKLTAAFRLAVFLKKSQERSFTDPETMYALRLILISFLLILVLFILVHILKCFCRMCGVR